MLVDENERTSRLRYVIYQLIFFFHNLVNYNYRDVYRLGEIDFTYGDFQVAWSDRLTINVTIGKAERGPKSGQDGSLGQIGIGKGRARWLQNEKLFLNKTTSRLDRNKSLNVADNQSYDEQGRA